MPFQDVDEVTAETTHTPSRVERVLRKIFVEDWSLKLLSLAITIALWLLVTGQNQPITTHVDVQLNFVRPESLDIGNDPPKVVDVTLSGSRSKLDSLSAPDLVATIDITDQRAGERMLRLSEKAQLILPHGIKVLGFSPSAIAVRLEPIIEKELPTAPRFEGKPAPGYEIYAVESDQKTVTVRGPASHLNELDKALTETIWLAGQKDSFTATNVAIDIADPRVELLDPAIDVRFEIGERRIEKSFSGVTVVGATGTNVEPRTASITLVGRAADFEELKSDEIRIVLDDALQPTLDVPSTLQGKFVLKSIIPSKFARVK